MISGPGKGARLLPLGTVEASVAFVAGASFVSALTGTSAALEVSASFAAEEGSAAFLGRALACALDGALFCDTLASAVAALAADLLAEAGFLAAAELFLLGASLEGGSVAALVDAFGATGAACLALAFATIARFLLLARFAGGCFLVTDSFALTAFRAPSSAPFPTLLELFAAADVSTTSALSVSVSLAMGSLVDPCG